MEEGRLVDAHGRTIRTSTPGSRQGSRHRKKRATGREKHDHDDHHHHSPTSKKGEAGGGGGEGATDDRLQENRDTRGGRAGGRGWGRGRGSHRVSMSGIDSFFLPGYVANHRDDDDYEVRAALRNDYTAELLA